MADQSLVPHQSPMPSILDRELSDRSRDAFGHAHFAQALRNLIESPHHHPPFSIGLLGSWGTGKSSIKELYLEDLRSDKTGKPGTRRADRIRTITFNAWRYGGEADIKRALLRDAFINLGGNEAALRRQLYQQVSNTAQRKRKFRDWAGETFAQIAGSIILILVLAAALLFFAAAFLRLADVTDGLSWGLVGASAFGTVIFLAKYVVDLRVKTPSLFSPQTSITFPSTSAEEYEWLLGRQIEKFRKKDGKTCERLVIFVDDLDRLSAAEMVAGLDAIRTFLEMPVASGDNGFGVIFVISCDEDRVAEALARGRGRSELPGSVFNRTDARRYLDRLFQFRLEIPLFPKQDMRQFAEDKLRGAGAIVSQLEGKGIRLKDVVDRLIHVDVQSPRNAIQLLNAFLQAWWIADKREKEGVGSTETGVLHEGAVTDHPLSLAALSVLRVDFPDFYDCVQKRPELIQEFNRVVFGTQNPSDQSEVAQDALREFIVPNDDKSIGKNVKREYRELRQYMSSIQDLRWAPRLQPLLLLSEDPITRKYGDRAAPLNDAFVSGDLQGVLEALGRNLDNNDLDPDDVSLLESLAIEVANETAARRTSAARVIAGLIDRIPDNQRRGLVTPLARQMVNLKEVRMNVGPAAGAKIIKDASTIDRREVAERFVGDLLHGDEIDWRLPDGGEPNLDEATQIVVETVDLAIKVRKSSGLSPKSEAELRTWLLSREISIGGTSHTLSFDDLSRWVAADRDSLLSLLGEDYAKQAIDEFQSLNNKDNPEEEIERIRLVHARLAEQGQEARSVLWLQLSRMVSTKCSAAAEAAWSSASAFADLTEEDQARAFLIAMAARLHKDMEDEETWGLDWKKGAQKFNDLTTQWLELIDVETAKEFSPIIIAWGNTPNCEEQAARTMRLLEANLKPAWDEVVSGLLSNDFNRITPKMASVLAKCSQTFTAEHKKKLAEHVTAYSNENAPPKEGAETFAAILRDMPNVGWPTSPWKELLEHLFSRCVAMHNQPAFQKVIFPSVAGLLGAAPKGRVGAFLKPLFEQAAGAPDVYPILHKHMIGHWPAQDDKTGTYGGDALLARACQFITDHAGSPAIGNVFASALELSIRIGVDADAQKSVSGVAPLVWLQSPASLSNRAEVLVKILLPTDLARIMSNNQPDNLDESKLRTILAAASGAYDEKQILQATKTILGAKPQKIADKPDGGLTFWLDALGEKTLMVIEKLIKLDSLNDEQHARLLRKALANLDEFSSSRVAELVPVILKRSDQPKTRDMFLTNLGRFTSVASSTEDKAKLANILSSASPLLTGDSLLKLCEAIGMLGGQGAFARNGALLKQFDDEQKGIIASAMPGIKFPPQDEP